jgi:hypothetical protein
MANIKVLPFLIYLVMSGAHGFVSHKAELPTHHRCKLGRESRFLPTNGDSMFLTAKKKDDVGNTPKPKDNSQLYGALAFFAVGCLFDFFVTHHGVGPWDPNYVL